MNVAVASVSLADIPPPTKSPGSLLYDTNVVGGAVVDGDVGLPHAICNPTATATTAARVFNCFIIESARRTLPGHSEQCCRKDGDLAGQPGGSALAPLLERRMKTANRTVGSEVRRPHCKVACDAATAAPFTADADGGKARWLKRPPGRARVSPLPQGLPGGRGEGEAPGCRRLVRVVDGDVDVIVAAQGNSLKRHTWRIEAARLSLPDELTGAAREGEERARGRGVAWCRRAPAACNRAQHHN